MVSHCSLYPFYLGCIGINFILILLETICDSRTYFSNCIKPITIEQLSATSDSLPLYYAIETIIDLYYPPSEPTKGFPSSDFN